MPGITFSKKNLTSFIDHHIAILERFGLTSEAPFSIVYFSLGDRQNNEISNTFKKILRQTDAVFKLKDSFIIILPNTDWNGATDLLSGIQDFLDQDAQDNIVAFPEDGKDAKILLRKLKNLIEDNSQNIIKLV